MALFKVECAITYVETPLPDGVAVTDPNTGDASVRVRLTHVDTSIEESNVTLSQKRADFTFTDVPEGSYRLFVEQLDTSGAPIGTPASVDFVVAAAPVATFFAPSAVSVTVTAQ
jgi:hypothetical protein